MKKFTLGIVLIILVVSVTVIGCQSTTATTNDGYAIEIENFGRHLSHAKIKMMEYTSTEDPSNFADLQRHLSRAAKSASILKVLQGEEGVIEWGKVEKNLSTMEIVHKKVIEEALVSEEAYDYSAYAEEVKSNIDKFQNIQDALKEVEKDAKAGTLSAENAKKLNSHF